jgi:glycosyltransferase involved in cell wall biosynthesis
MKVKFKQYMGTNHSWAHTCWGLARSFKRDGDDVDLYSTDGIDLLPNDLRNNLYGWTDQNSKKVNSIREPSHQYDCQISYTAPHNWSPYLANGYRNRFGIWCYEYPLIPKGFAKYHNGVDAILAPSRFAKKGFIDAGVPTDKIKVIPHGVDAIDDTVEPYRLKSKKEFKILLLIGQPHLRKGIEESFEAYFKAFTAKDDVVMIAKISLPKGKPEGHEVDVIKGLNKLKAKYPNHPEVELVTTFIPNVASLFKISNVCFSMTHCEAFYLPGLEAMQYGAITLVGRHGGQLDFCNDSNSMLIEGKEVKADMAAQYWTPDIRNSWFKPSIDDAVDKLRKLYFNYEIISATLKEGMAQTSTKMSWDSARDQIKGLIK